MPEPLDRTVIANVLKIIRATDLPPLPGDGSEPLDVAMRYVVLWQADEITKLRAELELDTEFVHAPSCTGRGISRMCAGCIEAEQLRHFAEIDRLTAIVERAKDYLDYLDGDSLETYGGQIRRDAMRAAIRAAQAAKGTQP